MLLIREENVSFEKCFHNIVKDMCFLTQEKSDSWDQHTYAGQENNPSRFFHFFGCFGFCWISEASKFFRGYQMLGQEGIVLANLMSI